MCFVGSPGSSAAAAELGPETCYIVADGNVDARDGRAEDLLTMVDRSDTDPVTNETDIGTGTGTFNIEAIALQPGTGVLFAADGGTIGTLDTTTGLFTALGPVGKGSGAIGDRRMKDLDGLSFDATTGFLYASERRSSGEDLLLRIDPVAGTVVPGAIDGEDYVVVNGVAGLPDIDAISVDPVDGSMYAVANDDGRRDHLVRIDKATGEATDIGVLGAQDVEGLGFASGQLIGTTGKVDGLEGIWDIDKATGEASHRRPLDNGRDYESFDCLNAPNPLPPPPPPIETPRTEPPVDNPPAPIEVPERTPQAEVEPVVVAPPAAPVVEPAAELPRTGREDRRLVLASGIGLAVGGLAVIGGTRRPVGRKRRRA
ncbi:MAG: hypothetical protein ACRDZ3_21400 [Acidimicrobiia bacterium]